MDIFAFLLAIGALIWAYRSGGRVERLEKKLSQLQREIRRLTNRLEGIASELKEIRRTGAKSESDSAAILQPQPIRETATPVFQAPPVATKEPVQEQPQATLPKPKEEEQEAQEEPASMPPPMPPATSPSPPAPAGPPLSPLPAFDWEALIGVKLFSWIAGIALVFAAIFFLKYSVDHGWLSPPVRMAFGLFTGAALLVACEWKAARRYVVTANALDAAGIAILFSSFFAAHVLWNLLAVVPTFVFMALVTTVAVLLSIRRDSVFIALLGLLGGFATPALLSTGEDRPISLFGYLLLLNAGLAWVAYRKRWPHLTLLSAIFTTLYQWAWVMKFLQAGSVPLSLGIFLVFPVLSFAALAIGEQKDDQDGHTLLFQQTSAASVSLPLLFAIYMAAVPAYGERYWLMFGFLFLIDAGLAAIAAKRGPELLHLGGAIGTVITFSVWLQASYTSAAWPAILGITSVFVLLYLVIGYLPIGFTNPGRKAVFAAPLLLLVFPILAAIEGATASPALLFSVLFALMAAIGIYAIAREEGATHFLAAFFVLAAEAVWSVRYLTPSRLIAALSIYAIFALFYLGVPLAARWRNKRLQPEGSGAIVLFASLGLLFFLAAGPVAASSLWGIALLLMILNAGLFMEASVGRHPILLAAGLLLSWLVIAVWFATVSLVGLVLPALVVVAGFAVMILGGNIWAAKKASEEDAASAFNQGLYLALIGHAFLLFVVVQKTLAVPPWPFLGVLAVLDLAIGIAALYTRRGQLHIGAIVASQLILAVWQLTVETAPWPNVAVACAVVVAVFGFVWFLLSRRLEMASSGDDGTFFTAAAIAAGLGGMFVGVTGLTVFGRPGVLVMAGASVILVILLLSIDWISSWHWIAPVTVIASALVLFAWSNLAFEPENRPEEFFFAAAIYVLFLGYPIVMHRRALHLLEPYLAAVMASATFFYFARHSLMAMGFADRIGLLPVAQAALMSGLLWNLLRLQPPGERKAGRLAMVAGAVLAFVTVAIPLQLEKQWITIGWALFAAALSWLYRRIPHQGLLIWTSGLLAAVFVRLVLNPAVFTYHPRGTMPILNWYLYTYLVSAAAFFAVAGWLRDQNDSFGEGFRVSTIAASGGAVLLFLLLNIEIADYYSKGPTLTFNFSADLAQDLTYTIGWGLFSFGLLIAGIALRSKTARVSAIALLSVTVAKCFLHDLWRLGGLYRVGSFVGLAICLTLVAVLLQKFVLRPQNES